MIWLKDERTYVDEELFSGYTKAFCLSMLKINIYHKRQNYFQYFTNYLDEYLQLCCLFHADAVDGYIIKL